MVKCERAPWLQPSLWRMSSVPSNPGVVAQVEETQTTESSRQPPTWPPFSGKNKKKREQKNRKLMTVSGGKCRDSGTRRCIANQCCQRRKAREIHFHSGELDDDDDDDGGGRPVEPSLTVAK